VGFENAVNEKWLEPRILDKLEVVSPAGRELQRRHPAAGEGGVMADDEAPLVRLSGP
jgi:hypothetical protein